MARISSQSIFVIAVLTAGFLQAGCHHTNRLGDFDYRGRSLATAVTMPSRPDIFTGDWLFYDRDRPLRFLFQLGSSIVKEAEAEKARVRMDSAYRCVDLYAILTERTLERTARYLGAYPIDALNDSDYLLDLNIHKYGIDAKSWDVNARFFMKAEAHLIDQRSGRLVWETRFEESEPLSPALWGPHPTLRNVLSAGALARLSVDEMALALEQLAVFTADRITSHLQHDLYKARG